MTVTEATGAGVTVSGAEPFWPSLVATMLADPAATAVTRPVEDTVATAELLETIRSLKHDGVAVLLSSHLLERVQSVCDRVALFNAGRIALLGTVPELASQVLGGGYHLEVEADGEGLAARLGEIPGVHHGTYGVPWNHLKAWETDGKRERPEDKVRWWGNIGYMRPMRSQVDLVYRDYPVADLVALAAEGVDVRPMRELFRQNRVVSSIAAELDQKSCWEVLTDPQFTRRYFSTDDRQVFRRHVLWTRILSERRTLLPDGQSADLVPHARIP